MRTAGLLIRFSDPTTPAGDISFLSPAAGEQRDDPAAHHLVDIGAALAPHKERVTNLMLAVEEVLDSIIDGGEELIQLDAAHGARAFSDQAALYPAWAK
jgi:hypothetical protein